MKKNSGVAFPGSTSASGRVWGLDLLRISLAIWVLAFHSIGLTRCHYGMAQAFVRMGAIAMTGFFMLSGFSLYCRYRDEDLSTPLALRRFFVRRFGAVYPAFFVVMVLFVCFFEGSLWRDALLRFPIEALGLATVVPKLGSVSHNTGTWFISCIIVCYLGFPAALRAMTMVNRKSLVQMALIAASLVIYVPFVVRRLFLDSIYSNPFFRFLEFFVGMALGRVAIIVSKADFPWKTWLARLLALGAALLLFVVVSYAAIRGFCVSDTVDDYMAYAIFALPLFAVVIVALFVGCRGCFWGVRTLRLLGDWSYCIFLGQFFTLRPLGASSAFLAHSNAWRIAVTFGLTFLSALALHYLVQRPAKNLIYGKFSH